MSVTDNLLATGPSEPSTDSSTVATQRHLWQIFTDENGEVHRHSVGIVKNPFDSEGLGETPTGGNPFTEVQSDISTGTNTSATVVPHETLPPPKPQRLATVYGNGTSKPAAKSSTVKAGGEVVVFEADKTYTRFDRVDEDHSEEEELGFPLQPKSAEEHHRTSRTMIRSDSDLMLPYIHGYHGNSMRRIQRWWTERHMAVKVVVVGTLMSLSYLSVVFIIIYAFS